MGSTKGLSPLIAAIVLIVITIAVGIIVSNFIVQFVTRHTGSQTICGTNTLYTIESAVFNQSGSGLLILTVTNRGQEKLFGFGAEILNSTDIQSFDSNSSDLSVSPQLSAENRLGKEESAIIRVNMTNYSIISTAEIIKVLNEACMEASAQTKDITKYISN